jgi:hypothetical protein
MFSPVSGRLSVAEISPGWVKSAGASPWGFTSSLTTRIRRGRCGGSVAIGRLELAGVLPSDPAPPINNKAETRIVGFAVDFISLS